MSDKLNSLVGCLSDYSYATNEDWDTLSELIEKAKKWDMIQWAVENQVEFVKDGEWINAIDENDIVQLEKIFEERESNE